MNNFISFECPYFSISGMNKKAVKLLALVPSVIAHGDIYPNLRQDLQQTLDLYKDDLPSPEMFDLELSRWKQRLVIEKIAVVSH